MFEDDDRPEGPKPTHIVMYWDSNNQHMLFRASDGICLGQCKNETLIFGDEPNKRKSHVFIDSDSAKAFLRGKLAADDLEAKGVIGPVVIEMRNGEPIIQLAQGAESMELPVSGSRRKIGGKFN